MKKLLISIILFSLSMGVFAQQKFNIINSSNRDIYISYFVTENRDGNGVTVISSGGGIIVRANSIYSAEDRDPNRPFLFPYNDFDGINQWHASDLPNITISSDNAYNDYGADQRFLFAKISIHGNPQSGDGGDIGPDQPLILGNHVNFQYVETSLDPNDPTAVIYNIMAF